MDEIEARVRCLELSQRLSIEDRSVSTVVEIARVLYAFVQASPQPDLLVEEIADKPRRGRPPKLASIME